MGWGGVLHHQGGIVELLDLRCQTMSDDGGIGE